MSFAHRPDKAVLLLGTKDGDGVEAWVTMDKDEMEHFRNYLDLSSMSVKDNDNADEFQLVKFKSRI